MTSMNSLQLTSALIFSIGTENPLSDLSQAHSKLLSAIRHFLKNGQCYSPLMENTRRLVFHFFFFVSSLRVPCYMTAIVAAVVVYKTSGGIHIDAHPCETFPGILCCLYGRDLCYLLEFSSTSLSTRPGDRPPRRSVQECQQVRKKLTSVRVCKQFTFLPLLASPYVSLTWRDQILHCIVLLIFFDYYCIAILFSRDRAICGRPLIAL
ncbi:hypothetical protein ANN_10143 [Periplaneta americana]|uniref:Uncharacterized protein n=1 Tax=Periplaneta americana TaxID=6978 RepID=A0ABQ8TPT2_PERAM|nr:hypothetical protein ANN_10143 [Periplaneta americana]